ncbi:MAG TPA: hypothetical protein PLP27_07770 [Crocinitomicaceae bacterium]|nr:hypothetical protein [Crocinitomicaceae bacterium]
MKQITLLALIFICNFSFGQTKDQTIKQLSRQVDSLETALIQAQKEIREIKDSNPKMYDQVNFIEKQEKELTKLQKENEDLKASISRMESQLKFHTRELTNLKGKLKAKGLDTLLSAMEVTNFKTLPQYAKNCACFYSQDQADYNNRQFLYIEDEGKDCLININDRQERLLAKGSTFTNERYTLTFENKKQIGTVGANKKYEATLTIKNTNGEKIAFPVVGVCGCD